MVNTVGHVEGLQSTFWADLKIHCMNPYYCSFELVLRSITQKPSVCFINLQLLITTTCAAVRNCNSTAGLVAVTSLAEKAARLFLHEDTVSIVWLAKEKGVPHFLCCLRTVLLLCHGHCPCKIDDFFLQHFLRTFHLEVFNHFCENRI